MTLPPTEILPLHTEKIEAGGAELVSYMRELVHTLEGQYQRVAEIVNGDIRSSVDQGSRQYTPVITGSTTPGVGDYSSPDGHQIGWVLRQGIMVDVWFDVRWASHTGTGTLQVTLPYIATESTQNPFVATISAANLTFNGYLTGIIDPGTRNLQIQDNQSGATFSNIAVTNADTTVRGHVRYISTTIERG